MRLTAKMANTILNSLDALCFTDTNGRYVYANSKWSEFTGIPLEDAHKYRLHDVVPEAGSITTLQTQKPVMDYTVTINGKTLFCSSFPIFDEGRFNGVLSITRMTGLRFATDLANKVIRLSQELAERDAKIQSLAKCSYSINNLIGDSVPMRKLKEEIVLVSRSKSTVLIEGETGTGKELVAHAIHSLSPRSAERMVRINCSAIPSELVESEFFGYVEGTFTGASKAGKIGKFELANHGTLFLDEISQLPLALQPKLLRPLQESEVERIGGKQPIPIDVRVIAATNVPLLEQMKKGLFREDLYYRINIIQIHVPPLRQRKEDIPLLVSTFLTTLNAQLNTTVSHVDDAVMVLFLNYDWPGNVRELRNVMEAALNRAQGEDTLLARHVEQLLTHKLPEPAAVSGGLNPAAARIPSSREEMLKYIESRKGNKSIIAKELGISRTTLYKLLKEYKLY